MKIVQITEMEGIFQRIKSFSAIKKLIKNSWIRRKGYDSNLKINVPTWIKIYSCLFTQFTIRSKIQSTKTRSAIKILNLTQKTTNQNR